METILITAFSENNVIGIVNELPWKQREDLRYFKEVTAGHAVCMGRKTHEAIGRALPHRRNILLSKTLESGQVSNEMFVVTSVEGAIITAELLGCEKLFFIGGASVYEQVINIVDKMYITEIHGVVEGDTYFPEYQKEEWNLISEKFYPADEHNQFDMTFKIYE